MRWRDNLHCVQVVITQVSSIMLISSGHGIATVLDGCFLIGPGWSASHQRMSFCRGGEWLPPPKKKMVGICKMGPKTSYKCGYGAPINSRK